MGFVGAFNTSEAGAQTPTIANETIAIANTEQSYSIPVATKILILRNRSSYLIKYTYTSTESGTKFRSLYPDEAVAIDGLKTTSSTLYFQSPAAGGILEVESWA